MDAVGYLGVIDYVVIAGVLLISAGIGVYFGFCGDKQKSTTEFLMAGRNMSSLPVILSLVVTFISSIMMVGIPAEIHKFGLYRVVTYFGVTLGHLSSAYIFLPVYFQMGTSVSVFEYLEKRFGKIARDVASIVFIIQTLFFVAVVLYAPAMALNAVVTTLPTWASIIAIGAVCTFYCSLGGLKAVLWTDVFQSLVMYTTIFSICIVGVQTAGGISEVFRKAGEAGRLEFWNPSTSLTDRYTLWNSISYGFLFGLAAYGCNQSEVQRMLSVKNLKISQKSVILSVPVGLIFVCSTFIFGIIIFANFYDCDPLSIPEISKITRTDQLVPYFILKEMSKYPGLAGVCIAGIFSGSLSTVSSAVNSLSAVTMQHFIRPYLFCGKLTEEKSTYIVKILVFSYGVIAIALSFLVANIKGIVKANSMLLGSVAGPILGLFMLGMMTVSANEMGAVTGLVAGFVVAVSFVVNSIINSSRDIGLPVSIAGCNFTGNASFLDPVTYSLNMSSNIMFLSNETTAANTEKAPTDIAFMWFISFGFATTIIVGYIASFLKDRKGIREVDPILISPPLRKWLIKPLPQRLQEEEKEMKLLFKSKTDEENEQFPL